MVMAEGATQNGLLEVPDIRQHDHYSCGACAAMSVGRYFGVGPGTLPEWKQLLGTAVEHSTDPQAIVETMRSFGLKVEAQDGMTIDDLAAYCERGMPVIVCVQDYGPFVPEKAEWPYGHYLTVIGVLNPTPPGKGYVFCQDSSADNVIGNSGSIQAAGRVMIDQADFWKMWHDVDEHGTKYVRFGIAVGPATGEEGRRARPVTSSGRSTRRPGWASSKPARLHRPGRWPCSSSTCTRPASRCRRCTTR